jgi:hypothetical protein
MNHELLDLLADSCNPVFLLAFLVALYAKMGHGKPARVFFHSIFVRTFSHIRFFSRAPVVPPVA